MALTAVQRQVVSRHDLGGDALEAALNRDYVVSAVLIATLEATSRELSHVAAFDTTLPANLVRIVVLPRGAVYYNIGGVASAAHALVPLGGLNLPVTKTVADTIQFYAAGIKCDMLVCIPR